jgi:hypothetical protein
MTADDMPPVTMPPDEPSAAPDSLLGRLLPGGSILDEPSTPPAVWGKSESILWAAGESLIIAGPDGTGKTTLAGQLVRARLGLLPEVLGLPVIPGDRNVLYLMMDRPRQAVRALGRQFTASERGVLDARLKLWRGPPPSDLAREPGMLAHLCKLAGAGTCIVDSLKDAALKLSDDETGSGWNRARQAAIEAGTELIELHHPRKPQDGNRKPGALDDLYGSRWITAGAGSVVYLLGEAGADSVEFKHLKSPAAQVGQFVMTIDHETGTVTGGPLDLVQQVTLAGNRGLTAAGAAKLLSGTDGPTEVKRAVRKLDKLTDAGLLYRRDGTRGGGADRTVTTWFRKAPEAIPQQSRRAK